MPARFPTARWRRASDFLHQQDTKCVAGADVVRLVFDSRAPEKNRFVECFPFQTNRHFPISTRISRANFRRGARVHNCFFGFALDEEREGKVCAVIICGYRERMRPKRIGVAPKSGLMIRASAIRSAMQPAMIGNGKNFSGCG